MRTDKPSTGFARGMNATIIEPVVSHVPMLSKPGAMLDMIRDAASAVARVRAAE